MRALAIIALLASASALATDKPRLPTLQAQQQAQAQQQQQAQAQQVEQRVSDESNTEIDYDTDYKRNAPATMGPSMSPSGPCMGVRSAGGSGTAFGISLGTSKIDKGCEQRETARLFAEMGATETARGILCKSDAVKDTIGEQECLGLEENLQPIGVAAFAITPPPVDVFVEIPKGCKASDKRCKPKGPPPPPKAD